MNLDRMARFGANEIVDAVVIGTGAGGAPILQRLAAAGLSVVALEAGRNRHPEREFVADEAGSESLYWMDERISGGATPEAFGANNSGIGVGGSTLHWGAFVPRADPRDLALRTETGVGEDWPIRARSPPIRPRGTWKRKAGASGVPTSSSDATSAGPSSSPRSEGLIGAASMRTSTSSSPGAA